MFRLEICPTKSFCRAAGLMRTLGRKGFLSVTRNGTFTKSSASPALLGMMTLR
jgi:hypothetical protein